MKVELSPRVTFALQAFERVLQSLRTQSLSVAVQFEADERRIRFDADLIDGRTASAIFDIVPDARPPEGSFTLTVTGGLLQSPTRTILCRRIGNGGIYIETL
jgi:hypothetical protein